MLTTSTGNKYENITLDEEDERKSFLNHSTVNETHWESFHTSDYETLQNEFI